MAHKLETILVCLCVILCATVLSPISLDRDLAIRWLVMALSGIFGFCLFSCRQLNSKPDIGICKNGIFKRVFLFFLISLSSGFCAVNKGEWIYECLKIIIMMVLLVLIAQADKDTIIKTIIVTSLGLAIFGIYQQLVIGTNVCGTMGNRNLWASAMALCLPFCIYGIRYRNWWTIISLVSAVLLILNIAGLSCRASIIGIMTAGFAACLLARKYKLLLILTLIMIGFCLFKHKSFTDTGTLQTRYQVWKASTNMIGLFGCGAGNWQIVIPQYAAGVNIPGFCETRFFQRPHNDFICQICEVGIIGFLAYCSIFFYGFVRSIKRKNILVLSGLLIYVVDAMFSFPKERAFHTLILLVYLVFVIPHRDWFIDKKVYYFAHIFVLLILLFAVYDFSVRFKTDCLAKKIRETANPGQRIEMIEISRLSDIDAYSIPFAWHKGASYYEIGQLKAAIIEFKKALRGAPYHIYPLRDLAKCLEMTGNFQAAEKYYARSLTIRDCPDIKSKLKRLRNITDQQLPAISRRNQKRG
jgi:hypothetical protein